MNLLSSFFGGAVACVCIAAVVYHRVSKKLQSMEEECMDKWVILDPSQYQVR